MCPQEQKGQALQLLYMVSASWSVEDSGIIMNLEGPLPKSRLQLLQLMQLCIRFRALPVEHGTYL